MTFPGLLSTLSKEDREIFRALADLLPPPDSQASVIHWYDWLTRIMNTGMMTQDELDRLTMILDDKFNLMHKG